MQPFLELGEAMVSPAHIQSVEKEYTASCILTFENGRRIRVGEPYPDVCRKIQESLERDSVPEKRKEDREHGD